MQGQQDDMYESSRQTIVSRTAEVFSEDAKKRSAEAEWTKLRLFPHRHLTAQSRWRHLVGA
jgi:hypothetical protein